MSTLELEVPCEDQREISGKGPCLVLGIRVHKLVCCAVVAAALVLGIIAMKTAVGGEELAVGSEHSGPNQQRGTAYMQSQAQVRLPALSLGGSTLEWYCLNDIVMGGRSSSHLKLTATGLLQFSGSISTVGGGFASCRTSRAAVPVPVGATGILLEVKGAPTHAFKFTMSADTYAEGEVAFVSDSRGFFERRKGMSLEQRQETLQQVTWQCPIPLDAAAGLQKVFLPFTDFRPSWRGRKLTGLILAHQMYYYIGLNAGVFGMEGGADQRYTDGPFAIEVASISFA